MRKNIVHSGANELKYEIRGIVKFASEIEKEDKEKLIWENIGDPLSAGEELPEWLKKIVEEEVKKNDSYAYCPTKGVLETRKYISKERKQNGIKLNIEDILFFNGLGDAIATTYFYINKNARVIGPDPAYPAHSSAESARIGDKHITYKLDPENNWLPDLKDLENKIKYNESISGILIINPGNPSSKVLPKKILEKIISLAQKYDLFIISDEVYANLAFDSKKYFSISKLIKNVPAIVMKGLSKEVPWPGSRCGWIEFYNKKKDKIFNDFSESIVNAKMLEVCATTLPQRVLPKILSSKEFQEFNKKRIEKYKKRADLAYEILAKNKNIIAPKPDGAFYYSVVFKKNKLKKNQGLKIDDKNKIKILEKYLDKNDSLDKIFVYHLIAKYGIVTVPLSSFNSKNFGFRFTLLEEDEIKFKNFVEKINKAIDEFLK